MASDLLSIAKSGAQAARLALDVTAQNIANASTEGYVRRSVQLAEVASAGGYARIGDVSLSGVRLDRVVRNADMFRQAEVRRTGGDAARSSTELTGLENIETAVEQSQLFPALTAFEASLSRLSGDPVDPSLRAAVIEDGRTLARTFGIAVKGLDSVGEGLRFEAADGVNQVNLYATELARVNLSLARTPDAGSDQSALLDQRDTLLQKLSGLADLTTTFSADKTVEVRLGGAAGPQLVAGSGTNPLGMVTAGDGTISFTLGGGPVAIGSGSLAGRSLALTEVAATRLKLDDIADDFVAEVNGAQTAGAALDGSTGLPMFAGSTAATIAMALTDGAQIATAPAGAGPGSRDPAGLAAIRAAIGTAGTPDALDALIFDISGKVAGRKITDEAIGVIAGNARVALETQAGVSLDAEAVNLIRYQQAFQASGKVMQVASTLFDTLLAIR